MIGMRQSAVDADAAYAATLSDVLERGDELSAGETLSVGSGRRSKELLDYSFVLENPRERLVWNPKRRLSLPGAIARFVWMMAANDRLKDIEFYWGPRVSAFSDDGVLVIGSNYGQRMLNPRPGINQVAAIIERLQEDVATRRAAISIYEAEDSVRKSHDIPCAFGLMFHVRTGRLHSSVLMRSNNAFILMPYNIFEFSLLAEAVAAELKVPFGPLFYLAGSMHIYQENYEQSADVIASAAQTQRIANMPVMPQEPSPIQQIRELVKLEAEARHAAAGFSSQNFDEWLTVAESRLSPYWRQLFYLLLLDMAQKRKIDYALDKLSAAIESPWREYLPTTAFATSTGAEVTPIRTLFGDERSTAVRVSSQESLAGKRLLSLEGYCEVKSKQLQAEGEQVISFSEFKRLRRVLVGNSDESLALAARDLDQEVSSEEFDSEFRRMRADGAQAETA
jgi:thymidylate synthase